MASVTIAMRRLAPFVVGIIVFWCICGTSIAQASAPTKKAASSDEFLSFDAITVSILERMRVRGYLTVEFALYVPDEHFRDVVEKSRRALKDAYVRTLVNYGAGVARVNAVPDLDGIATQIQNVTDSVLGRNSAHVLLAQVQLRRLH